MEPNQQMNVVETHSNPSENVPVTIPEAPNILVQSEVIPVTNTPTNTTPSSNEPSAPASLTFAPPSYSFVMRQAANQQPRTRFMGTFVASPSFVHHPPPPSYAATYDLYVQPHLRPLPATHQYTWGFHPIAVVCRECGNLVLTSVRSQVTLCTHLCAGILCLCFCWICVPLPYLLRSCKNVYHYCPLCGCYLGLYSPASSTV